MRRLCLDTIASSSRGEAGIDGVEALSMAAGIIVGGTGCGRERVDVCRRPFFESFFRTTCASRNDGAFGIRTSNRRGV